MIQLLVLEQLSDFGGVPQNLQALVLFRLDLLNFVVQDLVALWLGTAMPSLSFKDEDWLLEVRLLISFFIFAIVTVVLEELLVGDSGVDQGGLRLGDALGILSVYFIAFTVEA